MNRPTYRVRAEHPRRPGQSLRITTASGRQLGVSGETCDGWSDAEIASALRNGYIEPVPATSSPAVPAARRRRAAAPAEEDR